MYRVELLAQVPLRFFSFSKCFQNFDIFEKFTSQLYYIRLMAESLLEGKEERADLNKIKMKKEFFEKVEAFVKKSTFFSKMLKFNGKEASYSVFFKESEIKKS